MNDVEGSFSGDKFYKTDNVLICTFDGFTDDERVADAPLV